MPKRVDHRARRESIARALWRIVDQHGWERATLREVAREAEVSLGQVQHYFTSRADMLSFATEFAAEQTRHRIEQGLSSLSRDPHPRDVLRIVLIELLPFQPDARATSRMNTAYVLEAMHDPALRRRLGGGMRDGRAMVERLVRAAMDAGQISPERDPIVETDLVLALTGFGTLLELEVVAPAAVLTAIDQHLDQLFRSA